MFFISIKEKMSCRDINVKKYNKNDYNSSNDDELINKINNLLQNCNFVEDIDNYKSEIEDLKNKIKLNLNNNIFINSVFDKLKKYINSSYINISQKENILSLIIILIEIDPIKFLNYTDEILSLYQIFFSESYIQLFHLISQNFGDLINLELSSLNNSTFPKEIIDKYFLISIYNKYKSFCINNIQSNSIFCQTCGILCLSSFIENCSFNYDNNNNLKEIFDILMKFLDNQKENGKLEILNCLTSIILCSEMKFIPYAKYTVTKIIDLCTDKDLIIKTFALNIISALMYYCQDEIMPLKDIILPKLNLLKNEKSPEIKELIEQIHNNFAGPDKLNNKEKPIEIKFLNKIKISPEKRENKNIDTNLYKNNKIENNEYYFENYDNHFTTEPNNILNLNNKNIQKINIKNNKNKNKLSTIIHKNKVKNIIHKSDIKQTIMLSRSKSFGQKNILKVRHNEIKNKSREGRINNKIGKFLTYNINKAFRNKKDTNILAKNNKKLINNSINNPRIELNNRLIFIKNYSFMYKPSILKLNNVKKNNNSFTLKRKNNLSIKPKIKRRRMNNYNNVNITQNIINDYYTIINNNDFFSIKKISPQKTFNPVLKRKKNFRKNIKLLKENLNNKNLSNNNTISSKLLKKINNTISMKVEFNKSNNKLNCYKKTEQNKSLCKYLTKINPNLIKRKYFNKNNLPKNLLMSLKNSSRRKERLKELNLTSNNKNLDKRNNIIDLNNNICSTSLNKSLKNENLKINRALYISKNIKQKPKNILEISTLKRRNYHKKINQEYTFSNGSKEKRIKNNSPIRYLNTMQNVKECTKIKNKDFYFKMMKLKPKQKKNETIKIINKLLFKQNSIKMSNKNINIGKDNYTNNNNRQNNISSYKIIIRNKRNNRLKQQLFSQLNSNYIKNENCQINTEFNKYKIITNKIISELKNKVDELKKTIYIYENESKNKDKIKEYVKENEFIKAFNLALNINKIDDIYFVIKKYNYFNDNKKYKYDLGSELLTKIIKYISIDINSCDNLNDIFKFIINNIVEKKIKIGKDSSKLLFDNLINLYKNRKKNVLSELDIENIKYLIEYFKNIVN